MFDGAGAIVNRYLHGPNVDEPLAEDAVRDYTLSSTTLRLSGFGDPALDGTRSVTRVTDDYWTNADYSATLYRIDGYAGWYADVYDEANYAYVVFHSTQAGSSPDAPPTGGWTLIDDGGGAHPNAQIDSVDATEGTGWRTAWYLRVQWHDAEPGPGGGGGRRHQRAAVRVQRAGGPDGPGRVGPVLAAREHALNSDLQLLVRGAIRRAI